MKGKEDKNLSVELPAFVNKIARSGYFRDKFRGSFSICIRRIYFWSSEFA